MTALARHDDIDTSHNAPKGLDLTTLQQDVLDTFKDLGALTDKQLNAEYDGYAESTVRKRRSELTALGIIKDSGRREGRHAVWELA